MKHKKNLTKITFFGLFCIVAFLNFSIFGLAYRPGGGGGGSSPPTPTLDPLTTPDYDGHITLTWDGSYLTRSYKIYRSNEELGTYTYIGYTFGMSFTDIRDPEIPDTWYYKIKAVNYYGSSGFSNIRSVYVASHLPEKIGVFFWASDVCGMLVLDDYIDVLEGEGYTEFFYFADTNDFQEDFNEVDDYEINGDTIFFYFMSHGNYVQYNGEWDSCLALKPDTISLYSSDFRVYMDQLESTKKGFLVESCRSGGFVEDFQASPYVAISSTDTELTARYQVGSYGAAFSYWFWDTIGLNGNYEDAYNLAVQKNLDGEVPPTYWEPPPWPEPDPWVWQNPQINHNEHHGHDFFAE